jgi:hypothetical protein
MRGVSFGIEEHIYNTVGNYCGADACVGGT